LSSYSSIVVSYSLIRLRPDLRIPLVMNL